MGHLRRCVLHLLLLIVLIQLSVAGQGSPALGTGFDHATLEFTSLDAAINEFARLTGVTPAQGAQPSRNALVSLGSGRYLEFVARAAPPEGSNAAPALTKLRPVGWSIHTPDLKGLVGRLRTQKVETSDPRSGSRRRPDGVLVAWTTARVSGEGLRLAPFFIAWDPSVEHPSTTSPTGCTLERLAVTEPAPERLVNLLRTVGVGDIAVRQGSTPDLSLTLACPRGAITFSQ